MKPMKIKAVPLDLVLKEDGYELTVTVKEGPANLVNKRIKVVFNSKQLDAIGEWNPTICGERLDLNKEPAHDLHSH